MLADHVDLVFRVKRMIAAPACIEYAACLSNLIYMVSPVMNVYVAAMSEITILFHQYCHHQCQDCLRKKRT